MKEVTTEFKKLLLEIIKRARDEKATDKEYEILLTIAQKLDIYCCMP